MAGRPKSINNTKVFDVAKPSRAKPIGTSRPVIITHAAPVTDRTLVEQKPAEKALAAPSAVRKIIKPVSMDQEDGDVLPAEKTAPLVVAAKTSKPQKIVDDSEAVAVTVKTTPTTESTAQPATDEPKPEDVSETALEPEAPAEEARVTQPNTSSEANSTEESAKQSETTTPEEQPDESAEEKPEGTTDEGDAQTAETADTAGSEAAGVDALAEASQKSKQEQKAAEEQTKKDAALQELINSKKYFVPLAHDSTSAKKHTGIWIFLLVLILAAGGAYAAIDAKLVKTDISLPHHFFKQ
jgi:hypothetical protein